MLAVRAALVTAGRSRRTAFSDNNQASRGYICDLRRIRGWAASRGKFAVEPALSDFDSEGAARWGTEASTFRYVEIEKEWWAMQAMTAGVTKANSGIDGIVWNILGQTYVPKQLCETSFSWHATLPPTTFVPPHIHPTQDEFIYMLEGRMDALIDGKEFAATAGDLIRLPMGIPHGLFNKSDQVIKCIFWVTPTRKLYDLFWAIHSMKEQNPPDVVALSAKHEVNFLPPPGA